MLKNHVEKIALALIFLITMTTRFVYLGYSDYIGDEHKAFYQPGDMSISEFFLSRRKGPMQFVFSHIPYLITGDFRNELAQRIPFAVTSVAAVFVFYKLLREMTENRNVSLLATLLYSINGFIVGFGRIAQYQNQNLLFSFLALLFYAKMLKNPNKGMKFSLLGTFMWCLSFFSHWDAIFILPVVVAIFIQYLTSKSILKKEKIKLIASNFLLGCLVLLPFMIPYTKYQMMDSVNSTYFRRRVSIGESEFDRYVELIRLYNPFLTLSFVSFFGLIGLALLKKTYRFSLWFLFGFIVFAVFIRKPGTHIYNFVVPALILASYGVDFVVSKLKRAWKFIFIVPLSIVLGFLVFQTYSIFIDHRVEYPWDQEVYIDFKDIEYKYYEKKKVKTRDRVYHKFQTPKYTYEQKLPLFGFPHSRKWNEIHAFIESENQKNNEKLGYFSNEVKTITEWYMDAKYQADGDFYAVGVKRPLSFVNDWKLTYIKGKETVKEFTNDSGEVVVRIYRVGSED